MSKSVTILLQGVDQFSPVARGATEAEKRLNAEIKMAQKIFEATRTDAEHYSASIGRLTQHLNAGRISQDTFNRAAAQLQPQVQEAGESTIEAGQAGNELFHAFTRMALGALAFNRVLNFSNESIAEFVESEENAKKLGIAVASLGDSAPTTAGRMQQLAAAIHQTTSFEDDAAIKAGQLLMAVRDLSKDGFENALFTAVDLAAFMGEDLPSAAETLAMALSKPEKASKSLRSAGILLTEEEENQIKAFEKLGQTAEAQGAILSAVMERVSGSADEMRNTTKGALDQMSKDWADLKEAFGGNVLAPALRTAAQFMQDLKDTGWDFMWINDEGDMGQRAVDANIAEAKELIAQGGEEELAKARTLLKAADAQIRDLQKRGLIDTKSYDRQRGDVQGVRDQMIEKREKNEQQKAWDARTKDEIDTLKRGALDLGNKGANMLRFGIADFGGQFAEGVDRVRDALDPIHTFLHGEGPGIAEQGKKFAEWMEKAKTPAEKIRDDIKELERMRGKLKPKDFDMAKEILDRELAEAEKKEAGKTKHSRDRGGANQAVESNRLTGSVADGVWNDMRDTQKAQLEQQKQTKLASVEIRDALREWNRGRAEIKMKIAGRV